MKDKLKVALIGCGVISDNHICAILNSGNAELVALCDTDKDRALAKKEHHGLCAKIYTDYLNMLECERLDVVHIATPHYLHKEMAVAALKRNINVFLEKPMCIKDEDIEIIINAEKESRGRVCVCFQNRFNKITRYAKAFADEDGGVISARFSQFWKRDAEYYAQDEWRGKKATEGGGVMINQAIHQLDLLCFFLGKPQRICASVSNHSLKGIIDVEDSCEAMIDFENGKRANFYATNASLIGDYTSVVLTTKNRIIELRHPYLYVDGTLVDEASNVIPSIGKACYGEGHDIIVGMFYEALIDGTDVPVSLSEAQYATRLVLGCYKSNDTFVEI